MTHIWKSRRSLLALVLVVATAASAAGCAKRGDANNGSGADDDLSIVVVSGPLDDPYFSALKRGSDDAAEQFGVTVEYMSPSSSKEGSGPTLARLVRDAINKKPDAMVVANFFPDAQNSVIEQATAGGIPVIIHNTGSDNWQELGALSFVGLEPGPVGTSSATALADLGVTKALCVNPVPGNPFLEAACDGLTKGMKERGKDSATITIPYADATNPTKVKQAIAGALRADSAIDGVFVFGSAVAGNAQQAAEEVGRDIKIGTGDLSTQVLKEIQSGKIAFALDSQPYLQSFYSVQMAAQYVRFGLMPAPILTGPVPITQDNVEQVLEINEATKGVRGAA